MSEDIEHLISLTLEDGTRINFSRADNGEVQICHKDHCVILPKASGQVTLDFLALLEPFGKIEEPEVIERPEPEEPEELEGENEG